ncbi:hypothetical protein FCM35_KLT06598 [Carex littledalei]|uniref:Uncharacterized protein n=1 Tax=Carex littledalei TaxID=544730 RepID=A0A833QXT3_9POAL|nr:hypothetical protein FCM35_KLT06598 [Carex littledalei]
MQNHFVEVQIHYVNADKDKLKKNTATATTKNDPSKDASKPVPGPRLTKGLLKCSTSKPSTDPSDYELSEKNNLIEDTNIPSNVSTSVKEPLIEPVEEVCNFSLVETNEKAVYRGEKKPMSRKGKH